MKKFLVMAVILMSLLSVSALAQKTNTASEKQIIKLQNEIKRLRNKFAKTNNKKIKQDILDKIDLYQKQLNKLKKSPAKETVEREITPAEDFIASPEVEEKVIEKKVEELEKRFKFKVGLGVGIFGETSAFLGEVRFPTRYIFGPATTSFRISSGLAQNFDLSRRYLPVMADLIFNFPPGWLSATQNYLGIGLNYVALTSGRVAGTIGGQACYGIESEGFGGTVFGEVGYGILRTGFSASQQGITVMVGYRGWVGI